MITVDRRLGVGAAGRDKEILGGDHGGPRCRRVPAGRDKAIITGTGAPVTWD